MSLYYYRPLRKGLSISDLKARSVEKRLAGIDTSIKDCTGRPNGNRLVLKWLYGTKATILHVKAIRWLRGGRSITLTLSPLSKSSTGTQLFLIRRISSWCPWQPTTQYITVSVDSVLRRRSSVIQTTKPLG